jgi:hypothetical protein
MHNEEKFSDNEDEHLRIENELLRLKLSAQYGDAFKMESDAALSPEIENQFLKNIMQFEAHFQSGENKTITVYDKIGKPAYKTFDELKTGTVEKEMEALMLLLNDHGLVVDFLDGPYSHELMYRFITEELFLEEVDDIDVPGMMYNFVYEDFHPNDRAEIEKNTHGFFKHWCSASFDEYANEMDHQIVTARGEQLSREEAYTRIKLFSDCFLEFKNDGYNIINIQVDEQPDGNALGYSEGMYRYDGILESGEVQHFGGPYKLYMRREDNFWNIFYFVVPGFEL